MSPGRWPPWRAAARWGRERAQSDDLPPPAPTPSGYRAPATAADEQPDEQPDDDEPEPGDPHGLDYYQ